MFDMAHVTTVKGTVTDFEWTNPHAYVVLDVKDDKGNVEKWSAELGSPGMLGRVGSRKNMVKPGTRLLRSGIAPKTAGVSCVLRR